MFHKTKQVSFFQKLPKLIDVPTQFNFSTPAGIINPVQQGSKNDERIGFKIKMEKLSIRGYINAPCMSFFNYKPYETPAVYFAVFLDRHPNEKQPTWHDLFVDKSELLNKDPYLNLTGMRNINNRERFITLFEKVYYIDPLITSNTDNPATHETSWTFCTQKWFNIEIPLGGIIAVFDPNTFSATAFTIKENSLFIVAVPNDTRPDPDPPNVTPRYELSYISELKFFG